MLVDQFGKEIKQNRPVLAEISVQTIRDRYSNYPSHGLTPERLATILKEADQGDVYRQSELFEEMEEKDIHLGSVLGTRKLAVAGLEWEILPASESAEDKNIADKAKEMIGYIESWEDNTLDILDAIGKGFSVQEIMWDISEGQVWAKEMKYVHPKRFTFSGPPDSQATGVGVINPLLNIPRLITDEAQIYGEELLPNKFVFHRYKARSGATSRGGLCRPCSYMYLFKNYDIKDWLIFNELYSVPMRVGKYRAGASKDDIEKLKLAVFNLGVDAAAVISDSTVIELLESKVRGETSAFKDLAEFCEKGMSKAVLGHTGSSDSTPGKLGGEDQASEVRQDILEADAKAFMKTIRFQLLKPWVSYNFGPDKGVPKFLLHYTAEEDLEQTAKVYGSLVKDVNFKGIPVKHIHERFNIPVAAEGEETVSAAPQGLGFQPITNKTKCGCGKEHTMMVNKAADEWVDIYLDRISPMLAGLKEAAVNNIEAWLRGLSEPPTEGAFTSKIQSIVGSAYADIDKTAIKNTVTEMYTFYKLTDLLSPGLDAAFGGTDIRTVDFLAELDTFYLSKFIKNPEAVAQMNDFLRDYYHEGGTGLFGRGEEAIIELKNKMRQLLVNLTEGQTQRIVDTAVQRARNWGHISQLNDGGIAEIEVYEPTMDCDFCKAMHGTVISVPQAYQTVQSQSKMSAGEYESFLKNKQNQPSLDNIESFVDRGILPPYHPHCHGRIIKRIRK
jgi:phage gp29-like protein